MKRVPQKFLKNNKFTMLHWNVTPLILLKFSVKVLLLPLKRKLKMFTMKVLSA